MSSYGSKIRASFQAADSTQLTMCPSLVALWTILIETPISIATLEGVMYLTGDLYRYRFLGTKEASTSEGSTRC